MIEEEVEGRRSLESPCAKIAAAKFLRRVQPHTHLDDGISLPHPGNTKAPRGRSHDVELEAAGFQTFIQRYHIPTTCVHWTLCSLMCSLRAVTHVVLVIHVFTEPSPVFPI